VRVSVSFAVLFLLVVCLCGTSVVAQSPNGSITGIVLDPDGKTIPGAEIIIVNDLTRVQYVSSTNGDGIYTVANLPPGPYRIQVSKVGFKGIIKPDIVLNVQDALSLNFTLPIGAASVTVTVEGGAPLINTQSAAVSTVVDQNFVENIPLNGRSFQDLILLTPGVVTTTPQMANSSSIGQRGEFSVDGQRGEENYYTVDGVSATAGAMAGTGQPSAAGALPVSSALGSTQGLVSVDALQEFRVQTSSYSAEYGRFPGGQFEFVTRGGTNQWHATLFDYIRNDVLDANNWFNDFFGIAEPPLRQNDFGGTLGGRVSIPRLYNGTNRTFFFFSYEGLRLLQPQAATVSYVPDAGLRQSVPAALQPIVNAFALPSKGAPELGNGVSEFIGSASNPASLDAYSIRLDHAVGNDWKLFFRFGETPSSASVRQAGGGPNPAAVTSVTFEPRTWTAGATTAVASRLVNDFRFNYTANSTVNKLSLDTFGGAVPADLRQLQGFTTPESSVFFQLILGAYFPSLWVRSNRGKTEQFNVVDTAILTSGKHVTKLGIDYRRSTSYAGVLAPLALYIYLNEGSFQSNNANVQGTNRNPQNPYFTNFSAFVQDTWKLTPRLSVFMGVRWEVNPGPGAASGKLPYTVDGGENLNAMTLAPQGTRLWQTTWYNFAPRLGAAYVLRNTSGWDTVVRGGAGVFYDTGQQDGAVGYQGVGEASTKNSNNVAFPGAINQILSPIVNPPTTPYGTVYAFSPHLQLPYAIQWNASTQQALGKSQALTVSVVGSHSGRLLRYERTNAAPFNPNFSTVYFIRNAYSSDYNALQVQFQRRMSRGLQVLGSYSWSHAIDYGSSNTDLPAARQALRGNSDFDVRNSLSSAITYDLPSPSHGRAMQVLFGHWGIDNRLTARTAFPVNPLGQFTVDPITGLSYSANPYQVSGESLYVYNGAYPGGRSINPCAFALTASTPSPSCPSGTILGVAPRNFARGFGAWQADLALRREFSLHEQLRLQFRAEAFNVFNHPNFGYINPNVGQATFGQATSTLSQSLGILSPLYQMGGPRSMQFALKLLL
jgi:hypothetical protein